MLTVKDVAAKIEELAPRNLAEDWDNVGLQIGSMQNKVQGILVTLDITEKVIAEAEGLGVDLIVAHHPLIFSPRHTVTEDDPTGRLIYRLIRSGISLYVAHTNLDQSEPGINDWLAERLGLEALEPLLVKGYDRLYKLIVFVPHDHLEEVREAIFNAGGGSLGNYGNVSFYTGGTGTFMPLQGSDPYLGEVGKEERVEEFRLEVLVNKRALSRVIRELLAAHPYEEVAYDLIPLENRDAGWGPGRIGELAEPVEMEDFIRMVTRIIDADYLQVIPVEGKVKKVALCSGSGGSLIHEAQNKGADLLLTGEIKYHQALEAKQMGLGVLAIGHCASEKVMIKELGSYLERYVQALGVEVAVHLSQTDTNPLQSR